MSGSNLVFPSLFIIGGVVMIATGLETGLLRARYSDQPFKYPRLYRVLIHILGIGFVIWGATQIYFRSH